MKPHVQWHFEPVDARIQEAQLRAERKCAHIYAGNVEWSPQVKKAYELVEFWSMAVDTFQGRTINRRHYKKTLSPVSLDLPCGHERGKRWSKERPHIPTES